MVPKNKEIEMYKNVNFNSATSAAVIGQASKARVRVNEGQVQVRFTDRTSTVNMPKSELLRNVGVKGSGRRLGLPSEVADLLETGSKVALVPGKYGWFTIASVDPVIAAGSPAAVSGSVSA